MSILVFCCFMFFLSVYFNSPCRQCIFASGSPFDDFKMPDGRVFIPGYIFPGVGLGAIACGSKTLTDQDFYVAADALASLVTPDRLAKSCCYPPLDTIRAASTKIAVAVARISSIQGVRPKTRHRGRSSKIWRIIVRH
jgi:malic enzyme